jgi:glycosyltransferase involved in cell wall biosynthesis
LKRVFLSSGVLGPKKSGNQSIKNTIHGYLAAGYSVWHFCLLSARDEAHDFQSLRAATGYHLVGFPIFLMKALGALSRKKPEGTDLQARSFQFPGPGVELDIGESEITWQQVLLARVYGVFELLRMTLYGLFIQPELVYGYEIYGIPPASRFGSIFRRKTVARYQGTYLTAANMNSGPLRFHARVMQLPVAGVVMANDGTKGDAVLARLGFPRDRIFFQVNGLDPFISAWKARPSDALALKRKLLGNESEVLFGVFTRYYPYKRIDRAMWIFSRYRAEGLRARLVIGGGGGPLKPHLQAHASALGISDDIVWVDKIPFESMPLYYQACDTVFIVNDHANTGNQVLECIRLAVPVIATDDGNNSVLFSECPFARFFKLDDMPESWKATRRILDGSRVFDSPHILTWSQRMHKEVLWVQGLPE